MKKEHLIGIAIFLFFLSFVLDFLAGKVFIAVNSPMAFLDMKILSRYPLTAVEVLARSVGIVISVLVILDEVEKKPFVKAVVIMILTMLAGFYSIQQLATGGSITPLPWTLAFAYAAAGLVPFVFYYILRGIIKALFSGLSGNSRKQEEISNPTSETIPPIEPEKN